MVVGVMQFEVLVPGAQSLKDKRRIVRSVRDRLHREHLVAVAEVGALDALTRAVMAVGCIARDGKRAGEILDAIADKLSKLPDGELGVTLREVVKPSFDELPEGEIDTSHHASLAREMLERFDEETLP